MQNYSPYSKTFRTHIYTIAVFTRYYSYHSFGFKNLIVLMIIIPYQVADSGLDALGIGRRQVEGVVGRRRVGLRLRLGRALDPGAGEGRRLARDAAAGEQVAPPPRPRDRPHHDGQ